MSLDVYAIGTALAAVYPNVTAPAGTMGGTAIKGAGTDASAVTQTPWVIVELPKSDGITLDSSSRSITHEFPVYFLFQKASGDLGRDVATMFKWIGPLIDATYTHMQLGLGPTVVKSYTTAYDYGRYRYEGDEYHAWHLTVKVWTRETVSYAP